MFIITVEELEQLDACEEGLNTFVEANGDSATLTEALESNGIDDIFWYLEHTDRLTDQHGEDLRGFARKQALVNIDKIVDYCTKEEYDTILDWLHNGEGRSAAESAAESAAWSARSAAWSAAESAAWSARSAAESAAWSAAWSARSAAWSAAESAAWSARSAARSAWSAAESAAREEQTKELRQMFTKWEDVEEDSLKAEYDDMLMRRK